jgi:hypothetical protein
MNELLQALAEVPTVEAPIRWPDPPDVAAVLFASVLTASPLAARQFRAIVRAVVDEAGSADEVVHLLYEAGAYAGGHGAAECAAMLWEVADAYRVGVEQ